MTPRRGVVIVVGGTRGDVQPFLVLARALQRLHIPVRVAADARWHAVVTAQRIEYLELPADPTSVLLKPAYRAALSLQHGVVRGVIHTIRFLWASRRQRRALIQAAADLHQQGILVVASVATQWAMPPRAGVWGLLQPVVPTDAFVSPLWPFSARLARYLDTHRLMSWMMWQQWRWAGGGVHGGLMDVVRQPAVIGVSSSLMPPWPDRQPQHVVTGAWTEPDTRPLPASVMQFLRHGRPHVVITMGSPAANESVRWHEQLVDGARACNLAVIVHLPKGHTLRTYDAHDVCVVRGDINHQALFRGAVAVIHHGGAGTFHTACAVGVPSLIIARGVDQHFWGERAVALGVAPTWFARNRFKLGTMTAALSTIVTDPSYRHSARVIAQQMASEQGADLAAQIIAQYVRN